jgi:hypothetical protein
MRGLALKISPPGRLERIVEAPVDSLDWLTAELGGHIQVALTNNMAGRERIVVWCNDEFQRLQLPANCLRATDGWVLQGNLIVLGCTREGDTRGLTDLEERAVVLVRHADYQLPTLNLMNLVD